MIHVDFLDREEWVGEEFFRGIGGLILDGPGVRTVFVREVGHVQGLLKVQFPGISLVIHASVIIDAICRVGTLLDFQNGNASPDGMDGTGRYVEEVAGLNGDFPKDLVEALLFKGLAEFFRTGYLVAIDDAGIFLG